MKVKKNAEFEFETKKLIFMKIRQQILCFQRAVSFYTIKPKNKESR